MYNVHEHEWGENIELLIEYKEREGHCNVPRDHKEEGKKLGLWLKNQRQDKKRVTLDIVKVKQLEDLGIVWDLYEHEWDKTIKILVKYKNREGDYNVPYDHEEDGKKLGRWLSNQRHDKKRGELDTVKEKQLEVLGVVWDLNEYEWDENIQLLMKYKVREGHCNVPYNHTVDGKNLGTWLSRQRQDKKKTGTLDIMKEKQLKELGIVWDVFEHEWDENFQLLIKYKDKEGNCNVPKRHKEDGVNLGNWLGTQRQNKKGGTLDTVKEKQLEDLGIVWDAMEYGWDEFSKLLIKYKGREGHCNVPNSHIEDGANLGIWLSNQKRRKLSEVRQERLREIGVIRENPRTGTK